MERVAELTFLEIHDADYAMAKAWQIRGRADASIREMCMDKIEQIYDRLEELYTRTHPEAQSE
jgi:hypothetical protein